jgi:hypothetical protein
MKVTGQIYIPGNKGSVNVGWGIDGFIKVDFGVFLENLSKKFKFH